LLRGAVTGAGTKPRAQKPQTSRSSARTTIKLNQPQGVAKCSASANRVEVLLDYDMGAIDPRRLEVALRAFLNKLSE
jgi:ParB family chromosome partitioning protein